MAEKLKIALEDLADECVMHQVRKDLGIGGVTSLPGGANGMAAKFRIAELLGIEVNSVNKFKQNAGLPVSPL